MPFIKLLEVPKSWDKATADERIAACNGCGPEGSNWKSVLIPDHFLGLTIGLPMHYSPCCIHDWEYYVGGTEEDRENADARFYRNMNSLINDTGGPLKYPRRYMSWYYYRKVCKYGKDYFGA